MFQKTFNPVAVIGAGGKMGRGIALLLLNKMYLHALSSSEPLPKLILIDHSENFTDSLTSYLLQYLPKSLEKNDISLAPKIIDKLFSSMVTFSKDMSALEGTRLVFEAVFEDSSLKNKLLKQAKYFAHEDALFLSNTSSIPIHKLEEHSALHQRLIGFHFYNPPPVQKLIELIFPLNTSEELKRKGFSLAKYLDKDPVVSQDIAGFIGNGHFIREILFALEQVEILHKEIPLDEALFFVNYVTHFYALRPMGIFQVCDYVGLDVIYRIVTVMEHYLPRESFHYPLLQELIEAQILGGQDSEGKQKPGLFAYQNSKTNGVLVFKDRAYKATKPMITKFKLSKSLPIYQNLKKASDREKQIEAHLQQLFHNEDSPSRLACAFLLHSRNIAQNLVANQVASSLEEVEKVLKLGFAHILGPTHSYLQLNALHTL